MELSEQEKQKLGHEAFDAFLENFRPLDNYSIILINELFKLLMKKKIRDEFNP